MNNLELEGTELQRAVADKLVRMGSANLGSLKSLLGNDTIWRTEIEQYYFWMSNSTSSKSGVAPPECGILDWKRSYRALRIVEWSNLFRAGVLSVDVAGQYIFTFNSGVVVSGKSLVVALMRAFVAVM